MNSATTQAETFLPRKLSRTANPGAWTFTSETLAERRGIVEQLSGITPRIKLSMNHCDYSCPFVVKSRLTRALYLSMNGFYHGAVSFGVTYLRLEGTHRHGETVARLWRVVLLA